ncbi:MAG: tRNA pseudouridine(38-40) synthase TruA [Muribaculaceae bacterium]|nr:tRNA pseudouridine(38-40) synthase TruA [Muribaculaceae bacterium]
MRYFLKLSYNGEKFHGWQSQPNAIGVQQKIEEALSTVTRLPISIVGAGRTDAGVHAREMFAHFDMPAEIADKDKILNSLNRLVGRNIAISEIIDVADNAHARFDATERTYKYFVTFKKSAFIYPYAWHSPSRLDIDKMNEAAGELLSVSDFTSFAKLHSDAKTNICDVRYAKWETPDSFDKDLSGLFEDGIVFTISADRFLRNMVRAVVGTLVDVGRKKISLEMFKDIIMSKDRCSAGVSMPAEALFLWKVKYPYLP